MNSGLPQIEHPQRDDKKALTLENPGQDAAFDVKSGETKSQHGPGKSAGQMKCLDGLADFAEKDLAKPQEQQPHHVSCHQRKMDRTQTDANVNFSGFDAFFQGIARFFGNKPCQKVSDADNAEVKVALQGAAQRGKWTFCGTVEYAYQ
jgi:hypothetical protein